MQKLIATLLFLGGFLTMYGQYDPAFSEFYRTEIENLKANYEKEEVKLELVILYNDWLKDIKQEKASFSDKQADPVYAQRLEDLGNLEEQVINEMTGKKPVPVDEPPIAEVEDTSMIAGGMPDSLMAEVEEPVTEEPVVEEPAVDTINVNELPIKEDTEVVSEPIEESIEEAPEEEVANDFNETESNKTSTSTSATFAELLTSEIPGVFYRVQVFASAKPTAGSDVAALLSLKEEIVEEQHNGLYKYLVGKFSIYASAKARAEELKANTGVEAFVVGYKQEERTSLSVIFGY